MRIGSASVCLAATAALAVGSVGLASAQPEHHAAHAAHGHSGENLDLARQPTRSGLPRLVGIVNSDRDIEISDRTPEPGRYRIVVHDSARAHNWHLYGHGRNISTPVRKTGTWRFTIRLTKGNYRVICDPHYDDMEFDLVVG